MASGADVVAADVRSGGRWPETTASLGASIAATASRFEAATTLASAGVVEIECWAATVLPPVILNKAARMLLAMELALDGAVGALLARASLVDDAVKVLATSAVPSTLVMAIRLGVLAVAVGAAQPSTAEAAFERKSMPRLYDKVNKVGLRYASLHHRIVTESVSE